MLSEEIKKFFKGEVRDDKETLATYSCDASIFEIKPEVVVFPQDSEDIKGLVKFVADAKKVGRNISLTPRSGGTDMTGGPLSESIVLDMTAHFNQIHEIGADFAVVDPGVYYRDLDKETKRRDLFMPAYPASRELCTVGGMVANNSGGEKTLAYGKVERHILELNMVLEDGNEYVIKALTKQELDIKMKLPTFEGEVYKKLYELFTKNQKLIESARPKVTKNSAGYYLWNVMHDELFDLPKLMVGSQGTFGIITKVKFNLVPVKKFTKLAVIYMKDIARLGEIVASLAPLTPSSLEAYDHNTLRLAMRFFPDMIKAFKTSLWTAVRSFAPGMWQVLTHGMPKMVILAEFEGDSDEELDQKLAEVAKRMQAFNLNTTLTKTPEETRSYWTVRRESFSLLRKHIKDKHTAAFIDDIAVRPEQLPDFLPRLNQVLAPYKLVLTVVGHAGDGNFHVIPLMNLENQADRAIIPKLSEEVYNLVAEFHGSITAEHNDGLIRTPYLSKMYSPEVLVLFLEVKKIFDPLNIFNPGKKVNGSLPYALSHIKKSYVN